MLNEIRKIKEIEIKNKDKYHIMPLMPVQQKLKLKSLVVE